jgi:hypothetical protein
MAPTNTITSAPRQHKRSSWLGVALLVGASISAVPSPAAAVCAAGELFSLSDPVVTVIAGPGDVATEQQRWASLDGPWLDGVGEFSIGNETFSFEATP